MKSKMPGRFLILCFLAALLWPGASGLVAAGTTTDLIDIQANSLVLGGNETKVPGAAKEDVLHTMLNREVKVYIIKGASQVWPPPTLLGQTRFYRPRHSPKLPAPYLEKLIHKYAGLHGVDPSLVRAVMRHESGFNPQAVSPKGAQGLMQLMPGTADLMGVQNPFDPEQNIAGGVGYLRHCLDRFGQSVPLAVAAYNAGPARVAKSRGVPSIPETQNFVKNVLETYTGRPSCTPSAPKLADKPPVKSTAKMITRPAPHKVLPAPVKYGSSEVGVQVDHRPRAKVIEVRYPRGKWVAAKPQGAD